jgi:hypothetical protein
MMTLEEIIKEQIKQISTLKINTKYRITAEAQKSGMKQALEWVLEVIIENNLNTQKRN